MARSYEARPCLELGLVAADLDLARPMTAGARPRPGVSTLPLPSSAFADWVHVSDEEKQGPESFFRCLSACFSASPFLYDMHIKHTPLVPA